MVEPRRQARMRTTGSFAGVIRSVSLSAVSSGTTRQRVTLVKNVAAAEAAPAHPSKEMGGPLPDRPCSRPKSARSHRGGNVAHQVVTEVPTERNATIAATEISAAISVYSMAV